jgi:hypothetical protein
MSMWRRSIDERKREAREVERWAKFVLATPASDWTGWTLAHAMGGALGLTRSIDPETLLPEIVVPVTACLQVTLEQLQALRLHRRDCETPESWKRLDEAICGTADVTLRTERPPETLAKIGRPLCRVIELLTPAALTALATEPAA